jgi:hypothetical protein
LHKKIKRVRLIQLNRSGSEQLTIAFNAESSAVGSNVKVIAEE